MTLPPKMPPESSPATKATPQPLSRKASGRLAIGIILLTLIPLAISAYFMFWPEYLRSQILKTGEPAVATITGAEPTGSYYNEQPQIQIRLRVTPENGEPYDAETTMIVHTLYLADFQPGKQVKVKYDPNDPSKVAIEETESGQR